MINLFIKQITYKIFMSCTVCFDLGVSSATQYEWAIGKVLILVAAFNGWLYLIINIVTTCWLLTSQNKREFKFNCMACVFTFEINFSQPLK